MDQSDLWFILSALNFFYINFLTLQKCSVVSYWFFFYPSLNSVVTKVVAFVTLTLSAFFHLHLLQKFFHLKVPSQHLFLIVLDIILFSNVLPLRALLEAMFICQSLVFICHISTCWLWANSWLCPTIVRTFPLFNARFYTA